jgi:D-sedoheptulose 7-phosphate isomerase
MSIAEDPRHRNIVFDRASIGSYLHDYAAGLKLALKNIDAEAVEGARRLIVETAATGNRIYAVGNGGSAAIADHLCCDLVKGTHVEGQPVIDTVSMTSNVALYSAIANDFGFEKVFSRQVEFLGRSGDLLLAISSSGQSANIIAGVEAARTAGMKTIGLSGFTGGKLKTIVDVSIHVDVHNYGIVEDAHQAVMHVLAQYIACSRD